MAGPLQPTFDDPLSGNNETETAQPSNLKSRKSESLDFNPFANETRPPLPELHSGPREEVTQDSHQIDAGDDNSNDDDEEEFSYPGADGDGDSNDEEGDEFIYPGVSPSAPLRSSADFSRVEAPKPRRSESESEARQQLARRLTGGPSPAQLEAVYAAASSGDLYQLQRLFEKMSDEQKIGAFALANDATSRTGLTPLHAAASRGHLDIIKWLIANCGAMTDLEDKEGETALHKAALNGHLNVVKYLLEDLTVGRADVHLKDADGYTVLHNACSKGYLDIVKWLCEQGGACDRAPVADSDETVPGVDVRSKLGWTPLMNAASKGHLPVVRYLLFKRSANPLIRNNWGETAFDVAAAVFEIYICEVLQQAEVEVWKASNTVPYNPLAVHTTVPVILYENQRLDSRLRTLATNGGKPIFSGYHLGREGRKPPFELVIWGSEVESPSGGASTSSSVTSLPGRSTVPAWKSSVELPTMDDSFVLPTPHSSGGEQALPGVERSHFWMSDWSLDFTHPRVNVDDGWQYSKVLTDSEESWSADVPPQVERILSGSGLVSMDASNISSRALLSPLNRGKGPAPATTLTWARRRRWVRVMRRRLDITALPFLQPDGALYELSSNPGGVLVPYHGKALNNASGDFELLTAQGSTFPSHQDYVAHAQYLVDNNFTGAADGGQSSPPKTKRSINTLTRAVSELRVGMINDSDRNRKQKADQLLKDYKERLEQLRSTAGATLFTTGETEEFDDDSDDSSFHYSQSSAPGTPTRHRAPSVRSYNTDYFGFGRSGSSREPDLTPQLATAAEFRVPTHDAPQMISSSRSNAPVPHSIHSQWEKDENVQECRSCQRKFTFFLRKHHCRRCGRIFCDSCSTRRAHLDANEALRDPAAPDEPFFTSTMHRVCENCFTEATNSTPTIRNLGQGPQGIVVGSEQLAAPGTFGVSSQISDLAECPVCNASLADLGSDAAQAQHVRNCLEGDVGTHEPARYVVYKLPAESLLVRNRDECVICLEEFEKGTLVARLSCLCTFHNDCLSSWLQRGKSCPLHGRDV